MPSPPPPWIPQESGLPAPSSIRTQKVTTLFSHLPTAHFFLFVCLKTKTELGHLIPSGCKNWDALSFSLFPSPPKEAPSVDRAPPGSTQHVQAGPVGAGCLVSLPFSSCAWLTLLVCLGCLQLRPHPGLHPWLSKGPNEQRGSLSAAIGGRSKRCPQSTYWETEAFVDKLQDRGVCMGGWGLGIYFALYLGR